MSEDTQTDIPQVSRTDEDTAEVPAANLSTSEQPAILVRELKKHHYDRRRLPDAPLFWRERGDGTFRPFTAEDFAALRERFVAAERDELLDR